MTPNEFEDKVRSMSLWESIATIATIALVLLANYVFPEAKHAAGIVGFIVWAIYVGLYVGRIGPGRSPAGALIPALPAAFFVTWIF